ncbi:TetR/AcrR family transcriptional regulator [Embleya sp. NBC_00896]|uniref:TetR/AcrR family transcriptional regulator n=1 Tax=Embleya sp. NBC_00896 TaxID=2975961 RepID=UPI00386DD05D|nr:TetR/AcrR family transcriptional regulator [Embleya sp. NBC_00896]
MPPTSRSRSRSRARPGDGALLREEILRAATALLDTAGEESALTLRAVAARAGVTTPSVYLHFASKEALVEAVCLAVWEDLGRRMRDAGAGIEDPYQSMRRRGAAFIRFGLEHPVQYRLLMMRRRPTGGSTWQAADACLDYVGEAVQPCLDAGVLVGDATRIGLQMLAALHGLVALYIAQPDYPWPEDIETMADEVTRMAGLGSALAGRLRGPGPAPGASAFAAGFDALADRLRED